MRILISNPSIQYTRNTVKALLDSGHEVMFATAYWYRPNRLFEKIFSATPLKKYLQRHSDEQIRAASVIDHPWGRLLYFLVKLIPASVEQKSYWQDRMHDRWVSKLVRGWEPQLVIGYEKSCLDTFKSASELNAVKWLDLSQVHPSFIDSLRKEFSFFKGITGTKSKFRQIFKHKILEYELADTIFCLSDFAAGTLVQNGISYSKILVNPLGYNPNIFFPPVEKEKKSNHPLRIVYAGIITQRKGVHVLLEALQGLSEKDVHLTLIGPAGDASALLNRNLHKSNITYIPFLSQPELANELRKADVFLFPSFLDSWAAVVVEAMACGLPVIVTENTGAAQLVNEQVGRIIPVNDVNAIRNAILYFIDYPEALQQMGLKASEAVQTYSWSRYHDQLNQLLEQEMKNQHV
jgi:glycosyltransferase involved in cell wall biosynthesis